MKNSIETSTWVVTLFMFLFGELILVSKNEYGLAGLGLVLMACTNRLAWGMQDMFVKYLEHVRENK